MLFPPCADKIPMQNYHNLSQFARSYISDQARYSVITNEHQIEDYFHIEEKDLKLQHSCLDSLIVRAEFRFRRISKSMN